MSKSFALVEFDDKQRPLFSDAMLKTLNDHKAAYNIIVALRGPDERNSNNLLGLRLKQEFTQYIRRWAFREVESYGSILSVVTWADVGESNLLATKDGFDATVNKAFERFETDIRGNLSSAVAHVFGHICGALKYIGEAQGFDTARVETLWKLL